MSSKRLRKRRNASCKVSVHVRNSSCVIFSISETCTFGKGRSASRAVSMRFHARFAVFFGKRSRRRVCLILFRQVLELNGTFAHSSWSRFRLLLSRGADISSGPHSSAAARARIPRRYRTSRGSTSASPTSPALSPLAARFCRHRNGIGVVRRYLAHLFETHGFPGGVRVRARELHRLVTVRLPPNLLTRFATAMRAPCPPSGRARSWRRTCARRGHPPRCRCAFDPSSPNPRHAVRLGGNAVRHGQQCEKAFSDKSSRASCCHNLDQYSDQPACVRLQLLRAGYGRYTFATRSPRPGRAAVAGDILTLCRSHLRWMWWTSRD